MNNNLKSIPGIDDLFGVIKIGEIAQSCLARGNVMYYTVKNDKKEVWLPLENILQTMKTFWFFQYC